MNRRLYCAGPFTATAERSEAYNCIQADNQAKVARSMGWTPVVPHRAIVPGTDYEGAMRECFALLEACQGVLMLEGWEKSPGACRERDHAHKLGIPVYVDLAHLSDGNAEPRPVDGLALVAAELKRARAKFPSNADLLEALLEEVGELAEALADGATSCMRGEAVQVACVALRIAEEGDAAMDKPHTPQRLGFLVEAERLGRRARKFLEGSGWKEARHG